MAKRTVQSIKRLGVRTKSITSWQPGVVLLHKDFACRGTAGRTGSPEDPAVTGKTAEHILRRLDFNLAGTFAIRYNTVFAGQPIAGRNGSDTEGSLQGCAESCEAAAGGGAFHYCDSEVRGGSQRGWAWL